MIRQFFKNIGEFFNILVFDWLKQLTINLWEVIINIVFTITTSVLNLAFDILYILNPAFFTREEEQDNNRKNKIGF